jgi:hypothetical protein
MQLMYVYDHRFIIKRHVGHTWYGCWIIKALVETEVSYDCFTVSRGGIAALLMIARPLQGLIFIQRIIRRAKKTIS